MSANDSVQRRSCRAGTIALVILTMIPACKGTEADDGSEDASTTVDVSSTKDAFGDQWAPADTVGSTDRTVIADADALADTSMETSDHTEGTTVPMDAAGETDMAWRDTTETDADAALRDTVSEDGPCACVEYDVDASTRLYTTSLECFGGAWSGSYADYMLDPCLGLRTAPPFNGYWGERDMKTYPSTNLIGIETSTVDGPIYQLFYDATTHEKVGALRTSSWSGSDPIYCTPIPVVTQGAYTTVHAGRLPNCDFFPGGSDCHPASTQRLCPPAEAGASDAGMPDADGA